MALLSTVLDRRILFHRNVLSSHLAADDPHVLERVQQLTQLYTSQGASQPLARARALSTLDGIVQQQASVLSFNDMFYLVAALVLVFLPLVFLLGKPARNSSVSDAH